MRYFCGSGKDKVMLWRDTGLNSMQCYSESCEVGSMKPQILQLFKGQQVRDPKHMKGKIDLQLPADQYIYHANEDLSRKVNVWDHLQENTEFGSFHGLSLFGNTVELGLSLSLGSANKSKDIAKGHWLLKNTQLCSQTVIDLEEPDEWVPNKDAEPAVSASYASPISIFGRKLERKIPLLSDQRFSGDVKKDPSLVHEEKSYEKQGFFNKGFKGSEDDKASTSDMSTLKQQFVSSAPGLLDLNKVPANEPAMDLEDSCLYDLNHPCAENMQMSCEKSEVEDPMPFCSDEIQNIREKDGTRSPASYTSCCITDNDSTSMKTSPPRTESRVTELVSDEANTGLKPECFNHEDFSNETDPLVQMAAESLIHISFNTAAQSQDCSPQEGSSKIGNAGMEFSSDSYELMTLKLTESSADDYSVSSKPTFEVNNLENKDFSLKLRRGRRMKDFQKEILPSLVSLARHEIREDINILEAVLRSREYRKIRAKMGESCSAAPLKSKRSRARNVGRRRFK